MEATGRRLISLVFDHRARPVLARVVEPLAAAVAVDPMAFTALGLLSGLSAAVAAAFGAWWLALVLWLGGRVLDAFDGAVARSHGTASDRGGYLDFCADMLVYNAIPIGIGFGRDDTTVWIVIAVLLGSFAINSTSLSHLAAVLEKRGRGAGSTGERTAVTMPRGLVEGLETIVFFSLALAFSSQVEWIFGVMAAAVLAGALFRMAHGAQVLK